MWKSSLISARSMTLKNSRVFHTVSPFPGL